ncbi:hypothetical protein RJ639_020296 [Escallonia herrerae]|uniref:CCHC-type domain-containing protein n=1 Tax=Escallonia herrerae TaxID=1293975 RepID=A0AA88V549_9ASTE|nr:hypothetical protein RJ639_020296 [Escallonia herrerae]
MRMRMRHLQHLPEETMEDVKKKPISIALKASSSNNEPSDDFDKKDVDMIAKNFKKFLRFIRNGGRRQQNASKEEKICYKCRKSGHMKMDCPIYKKEKKKKRDRDERHRDFGDSFTTSAEHSRPNRNASTG